MGNQQGTNPYQHFQTQPNTSAIQSFPYGSTPSTWGYPLPSTPSTINSYYQQGYPPPKWPSVTNLPPPAQPQNFQGSYVSDNSIRGSQLQLQAQQAQVQAQMQAQLQAQMENQIRGNQLSGGYYGSQYGGGGYVDQGNTKMRGGSGGGNQQRVSGLGQQGQNASQLSYQQPSQIQQQ